MSFIINAEAHEAGIRLRSEILSKERVDKAMVEEDDLDEYEHLFGHECAFALVWARNELPRRTRSLVTVAMLAALGPSSNTLRVHVRGALRNGCTRAELRQILAMVTFYVGVPVGSEAIANVRKALAAAPEEQARTRSDAAAQWSVAELGTRGRELHREIFGSAIGASPAERSDDNAVQRYERIKAEYYFGVLWRDADLSPKERCLVMIAFICATHRMDQLRTYLDACLHLGCTEVEIQEVLLSVSIYCGALAYESAQDIVQGILNDRSPVGTA